MSGSTSSRRAIENAQRRRRYAGESARFDRETDRVERWLFGSEHRRWACSRAIGRTLEIAIGTGLNIAQYSPDINLTGLDLTPEMLAFARRRIVSTGRSVPLIEGDAQALPFRSDTFDTVLSTYSMCSVPDVNQAIDEAKRVLVPEGRLIVVDHIRSSMLGPYWIQRLVELMPTRSADELTRRPLVQVVAAGFTIEEHDRLRAGIIERAVARKPRALRRARSRRRVRTPGAGS